MTASNASDSLSLAAAQSSSESPEVDIPAARNSLTLVDDAEVYFTDTQSQKKRSELARSPVSRAVSVTIAATVPGASARDSIGVDDRWHVV